MRIVYLRSAAGDLLWLRSYYERVFPEGAAKAREGVRRMEDLVAGNPFVGTVTHRAEVRRLRIARTPFFVLLPPHAQAHRDPARHRQSQPGQHDRGVMAGACRMGIEAERRCRHAAEVH